MEIRDILWNERISGWKKVKNLRIKNLGGGVFATCMTIVFLISIFIRLSYVDFNKQIGNGDEAAYHYAAENLLKYGTFTLDRDGSVYNEIQEPRPTSALQIGYPLVLALLYTLFGHDSKVVFIFQFILSIVDLILMVWIMHICKCKKWAICLVTLLAGIYPGFIYNINLMLTEQLFKTLLLAFAAIFLYALGAKAGRKKTLLYTISSVILGFAVFTRGLAFPFLFLVLFMIFFYDTSHHTKNILVYTMSFVTTQFWWWIRNAIHFHRVMLLSDAGYSPKIWGMMPYYLDMASSEGLQAAELLKLNEQISLPLFIRWRTFGIVNYLWSDIWDEKLVHHPFRNLIWIHMIVIITVLLYPWMIRKCNKYILFITSFPIAFTIMNLPYHGLPRYLYPVVSFIFIALGILLSNIYVTESGEKTKKIKVRRIFEGCYFVGSVIFSIILFISLVFGYRINLEMSDWRLHKYLNTSIQDVENGNIIDRKEYFEEDVMIENSNKIEYLYENNKEAASKIKLECQVIGRERVATKVNINIQGGYASDYMTVYWKEPGMDTMDGNHVYRFPIHIFQKRRIIYIDGDIDSLLIVPAEFRGGKFKYESIVVEKIQY